MIEQGSDAHEQMEIEAIAKLMAETYQREVYPAAPYTWEQLSQFIDRYTWLTIARAVMDSQHSKPAGEQPRHAYGEGTCEQSAEGHCDFPHAQCYLGHLTDARAGERGHAALLDRLVDALVKVRHDIDATPLGWRKDNRERIDKALAAARGQR